MMETIPHFSARNAHDAKALPGGKALRAFEWSELAARIDAARDLRHLLRQNSCLSATSFTDAAAGYFETKESALSASEEAKPPVNHGALGGRKSSSGTSEAYETGRTSVDDSDPQHQGCRET